MKTITSAKIKKIKHAYASLGVFKDADTGIFKAFDESGNSETLAIGAIGPQGPQGIQGPAGPIGPAGLTWKGDWVSGTSYSKDDAVGYDGASWFCTSATSGTTDPSTDTSHWALLASQGATGPQGPVGPAGLGFRLPNNGLYPTSKVFTDSFSVNAALKYGISYEGVSWTYLALKEYTDLTTDNINLQLTITVTGTLNFPTDTAQPTLCAINLFYPSGTLNDNSGALIKSTKEFSLLLNPTDISVSYMQYYSYRVVGTDHMKIFIWQTGGTLESATYNIQLFNVNV